MNRMMAVALERLGAEGEHAEKLWAARIINGLRGCPNGLDPGAFVPHDWGPDDEIWEAVLNDPTLAAGFVEMMEADRQPGDEEPAMTMDEFLARAAREDATADGEAADGAANAADPADPRDAAPAKVAA